MAITESTITVAGFNNAEVKLKTQNNSDDGSKNPAHPILDTSGNIISPATSGNQATANAALASIQISAARIPTSPATAGNQDTANTTLATIAANTGAGGVTLTDTPTVLLTAYSTGKVLGGKRSFTGAARSNGGSGAIRQAIVAKKENLSSIVDLFVFNADPSATFTNGDSLPDLSADLSKLAGVIRCADEVEAGDCTLMLAQQQDLLFKLTTGTTLYVVPVIRGSETYAAADAVVISLGIVQN